MPETWNNAKGRATSGAAKTVLSSVYLTWAGWPLKDESKYALAAEKAKEVMDSGTYSLMPDYADLWLTENDNNSESIFAIQWSRDANKFINRMAQGYRAFEEHGWVDGFVEIGLFNRFPEGPRKEATFETVFETPEGTTINWQDSQFGHPTYKKWVVGGVKAGNVLDRCKNVPLFRYAEVLLTFAEAKAELGTLTQIDLDKSINLLRDRVNMPHLQLSSITTDPNWNFPELSPIINEIRRERRVELAAEGYRLNDLMRWRAHHLIVGNRLKGAKFNPSNYPDLDEDDVNLDDNGYLDPHQNSLLNGFQFDPGRDYLNPIPINELLLNENLTQNPGWPD